jgi:hypothetical protein
MVFVKKDYQLPSINVYEYSCEEEVSTGISNSLDLFNQDEYNVNNS